MEFIEEIKRLIANGEIKESSENLLEDTVSALLGDIVSVGKVIIALAKSPFFVREQLFWSKMEAFMNGVYFRDNAENYSYDPQAKLCAKLTENGEKRDNANRLVACIDRAETQRKIRFLINATRCLLADFIDLNTYFRICHAITHTLEEDLQFLRTHISECALAYSHCTQGLLTAGLMYQCVIDANGNQEYSFTQIASLVDRFAVSYDDIERYPNPIASSAKDCPQHLSIPPMIWSSS